MRITELEKKAVLIIVSLFSICSTLLSQTKVVLIPTLHGLHRVNQGYSYDSLKQIITRIQPDVIAVEIRDEDVKEDSTYLRKNYPFEMWMIRYWFPRMVMEGFDWLGADIEGKPIPENYWRNVSVIKSLEKQLQADSLMLSKSKACDEYNKQRLEILDSSSLAEILKSNDAQLVRDYYDCLHKALMDTEYIRMIEFYNDRNQKMMGRIRTLIDKHKGKVIVVLTGDDHYPYLHDYLRTLNIVLLHP